MLSSLGRLFRRHPLLGNTIIYGTLFAGAELSQQVFIRRVLQVRSGQDPEPLDAESLKRYCIFGYVVLPPILHGWYKWLDWRYVGVGPAVVAKKVFFDVFVMGPVDVFVFFYCMAWLEGREDRTAELRAKYWDTVLKEIYFWVPAQVLNFVLVPPALRVVFVGACAFIWNNILCWVKRAEFESEELSGPASEQTSAEAAAAGAHRPGMCTVEQTTGDVGPRSQSVRFGEGSILAAWNKVVCDQETAPDLNNNSTSNFIKLQGASVDLRGSTRRPGTPHDTRPLRHRAEVHELLPLVTAPDSAAAEDPY